MPISAADVGRRVVVRHRLPDGRATDVLGELEALDAAAVVVRRADGERVRVAPEDVVAARPVPPAPPRRGSAPRRSDVAGPRTPTVEEAVRRSAAAWPPRRATTLGDWTVGTWPGRPLRGRCAVAAGDPGMPLAEAVDAVVGRCRAAGVPPVVQVASPQPGASADDGGRAVSLEAELARRGWAPGPWTVLALRPLVPAPDAGPGPPVELAASPSPAWFAGSDRHGTPLEHDDLPAAAVPEAYATARVPGGGAAVARGAAAAGWLGLTCLHVPAAARRRGAATALVAALCTWGAGLGAETAFVQVLEASTPARALWARTGFTDHHRYRYWQAPA